MVLNPPHGARDKWIVPADFFLERTKKKQLANAGINHVKSRSVRKAWMNVKQSFPAIPFM